MLVGNLSVHCTVYVQKCVMKSRNVSWKVVENIQCALVTHRKYLLSLLKSLEEILGELEIKV